MTAGAGAAELVPAELMARAAAQVGRADWGDPRILAALELLIEAALAGPISDNGRAVLRSVVLRHLRNGLELRSALAADPALVRVRVREPVLITGLPRTGTTVVQSLLALDPRHRFLRLWEALRPAAPGPLDDAAEGLAIAAAERWLDRFYASAPAMRAIHPLSATGPEECDALLQNAFASQHFDDMFDADGYSRWLYAQDLDFAYEDYALQLRLLSVRGPDHQRWVLKAPSHLAHLGGLLRALPDVRIIHCHRNPVNSVASFASLIAAVRRPNVERLEPRRIGAQALARCQAAATRALAARDRCRPDRFLDVSFDQLVADPVGCLSGIYEWLDGHLDPSLQAPMRDWLASHPRGSGGEHVYDGGAFGLDATSTTAALAPYVERFGALWHQH